MGELTSLRQHLAFDLPRVQATNVVTHLQLEPEIRRGTEIAPEAHGRICRNASLLIYDGMDTSGGHTKGAGERVDTQFSLGHLLVQQLARMLRKHFFPNEFWLAHNSVIVHDFNINGLPITAAN